MIEAASVRRRVARVSAAWYRRAFSSAMAAWAAKLSSRAEVVGQNGSASSFERLMVTTACTRSPMNERLGHRVADAVER